MKDIGSQSSLNLAQGGTGTYTFTWDTSGASADGTDGPGGTSGKKHTIAATANAPGDIAPGNDKKTLEVLITPNTNPDPTPEPTATPTPTPPPSITFPNSLEIPEATLKADLAQEKPTIETGIQSATRIWTSPADAKLSGAMGLASIDTEREPQSEIFIGGTAVIYQPGKTGTAFLNPFRRGEVVGKVNLQGRESSMGAFLQVNREVHFVEEDGTLHAAVAAGTVDLYIRAPGYVPVLIPNLVIDPGTVVNIPELTLPFGDANNDGLIDIYDLSIAASNYGTTIQTSADR